MQIAEGYRVWPLCCKQHCTNYSKLMLECGSYWASGTEAGSSTQICAVLLDVSASLELISLCPRHHFIALYSPVKVEVKSCRSENKLQA